MDYNEKIKYIEKTFGDKKNIKYFYRFWNNVDIKDNKEECWNWTASTTSYGYGRFRIDGDVLTANTVAYILSKGDIHNGLWVQHLCNNPRCCNPNHLELGYKWRCKMERENTKRTKEPIDYEINSHHFWNKVDIKDNIEECWNWMEGIDIGGYGQFWNYTEEKNIRSHRMAYMLTKGPISCKFQIQHTCNNRRCCNPNHLRSGTSQENSEYMVKCNRQYHPTGENNSLSILTEDQVIEIHKIHKDCPELTQHEIAKMFRVSQPNINQIINGRTWYHICKEFINSRIGGK